MTNFNLSALCKEVETISREVGAYIRNEYGKVQQSRIESKSANNFVSYVDKSAEQLFVEGLGKLLPEAGFIAEEDHTRPLAERFNWVIDPLDGTTNFLHGVPCFATSIALLDGNQVVLGVIYEINQDECFSAWKDGGAFLNGHTIHVATTSTLKGALLATGFPYHDEGLMDVYLDLFAELMKNGSGLRRLGSAATDIAYVSCGRLDGFYEYGLSAWDIAAGVILVQEAGGIVSDFNGNHDYLFGKRFVCGTKEIHHELLSKIKLHFSLQQIS
jgi:myo-inositol-1(or 4)-monophosphatase